MIVIRNKMGPRDTNDTMNHDLDGNDNKSYSSRISTSRSYRGSPEDDQSDSLRPPKRPSYHNFNVKGGSERTCLNTDTLDIVCDLVSERRIERFSSLTSPTQRRVLIDSDDTEQISAMPLSFDLSERIVQKSFSTHSLGHKTRRKSSLNSMHSQSSTVTEKASNTTKAQFWRSRRSSQTVNSMSRSVFSGFSDQYIEHHDLKPKFKKKNELREFSSPIESEKSSNLIAESGIDINVEMNVNGFLASDLSTSGPTDEGSSNNSRACNIKKAPLVQNDLAKQEKDVFAFKINSNESADFRDLESSFEAGDKARGFSLPVVKSSSKLIAESGIKFNSEKDLSPNAEGVPRDKYVFKPKTHILQRKLSEPIPGDESSIFSIDISIPFEGLFFDIKCPVILEKCTRKICAFTIVFFALLIFCVVLAAVKLVPSEEINENKNAPTLTPSMFSSSNPSGYTISETNILPFGQPIASNKANEEIGTYVKLANGGNIVALSGIGTVRVFKNDEDKWVQVGKDIPTQHSRSSVPCRIALSRNVGDVLAIQMTNVINIFQFNSKENEWQKYGSTRRTSVEQMQDSSIAISADGSVLAIATPDDGSGSGSIEIYRYSARRGILIDTKFTGYEKENGFSIDISDDGNRLLVGSWQTNSNLEELRIHDTNRIKAYEMLTNGTWEFYGSEIKSEEPFVSVSFDSEGAMFAACTIITCNIYELQNYSWRNIGENLDGGKAVSLSSDGTFAVIGRPEEGLFAIYELSFDKSFHHDGLESFPKTKDGTGQAVSICGKTIAIGSPRNDEREKNAGVVHMYRLIQ